MGPFLAPEPSLLTASAAPPAKSRALGAGKLHGARTHPGLFCLCAKCLAHFPALLSEQRQIRSLFALELLCLGDFSNGSTGFSQSAFPIRGSRSWVGNGSFSYDKSIARRSSSPSCAGGGMQSSFPLSDRQDRSSASLAPRPAQQGKDGRLIAGSLWPAGKAWTQRRLGKGAGEGREQKRMWICLDKQGRNGAGGGEREDCGVPA